MELKIYIMSGAGNIFSVIDNRQYDFSLEKLIRLAPKICSNHLFKTEGLISLRVSKEPELNFEADFFNPDGSYGAMCGNGGRCAVRFADAMNFFSGVDNVQFLMAGSIYKAEINNTAIKLRMPPPKEVKTQVSFNIDDIEISGSYVNVGSDNFVAPVDNFYNLSLTDFYKIDLNDLSKKIRYSKFFEPRGVNVNIYLINQGVVYLRTYERGVEAETGACGTGAVSTALIVHSKMNLPLPVKIVPPSRIPVFVDLISSGRDLPSGIILSGPAEITDEFTFND